MFKQERISLKELIAVRASFGEPVTPFLKCGDKLIEFFVEELYKLEEEEVFYSLEAEGDKSYETIECKGYTLVFLSNDSPEIVLDNMSDLLRVCHTFRGSIQELKAVLEASGYRYHKHQDVINLSYPAHMQEVGEITVIKNPVVYNLGELDDLRATLKKSAELAA